MKNLVLASALGTLAGTLAIPALTGPIHYQVTKPHSMFGWLPVPTTAPSSTTVALGTAPMDFVVTDVLVGGETFRQILVTVNGAPVLNLGGTAGQIACEALHLTTGVLIPAGSTVGIQASGVLYGSGVPSPVTVAGYVQ